MKPNHSKVYSSGDAAVHSERLTGNRRGRGRRKKGGCGADFRHIDVSSSRRLSEILRLDLRQRLAGLLGFLAEQFEKMRAPDDAGVYRIDRYAVRTELIR